MKSAAAAIVLLFVFAFASNAHAVLRSRFPRRTVPPADGIWIFRADHATRGATR